MENEQQENSIGTLTDAVSNADKLCRTLNVYFALWATFFITTIVSPILIISTVLSNLD